MNKQPTNIFEQILFGIETTNENIVILAENVNALLGKIGDMAAMFQTKPTVPGEKTIGNETKVKKDED